MYVVIHTHAHTRARAQTHYIYIYIHYIYIYMYIRASVIVCGHVGAHSDKRAMVSYVVGHI
jgi:hypothetical protein